MTSDLPHGRVKSKVYVSFCLMDGPAHVVPRDRVKAGPRAPPPPFLAGLFCTSIIFLLIFSIMYSMYRPQAKAQPHSKKDFEDFVKQVAYDWAQEHGSHIDDQGIDLYGERDWSRPYGWTFLSHTVSIGSGRKVGNSTQQADMVVQFQGENPLEDKNVTKTATYTNTYSDKSHWALREGFKGGWSKGSAVPGRGPQL